MNKKIEDNVAVEEEQSIYDEIYIKIENYINDLKKDADKLNDDIDKLHGFEGDRMIDLQNKKKSWQ